MQIIFCLKYVFQGFFYAGKVSEIVDIKKFAGITLFPETDSTPAEYRTPLVPGEKYSIPEGSLTGMLVLKEKDLVLQEGAVSFAYDGEDAKGRFFLDLEIGDYSEEWFVFMPSACYDGNRFRMVRLPYGTPGLDPFFPDGKNQEKGVVLREIPSLDNGFNRLITDSSAPVAAIFMKEQKKALFFSFEEGTLPGEHGVEMEITQSNAFHLRLSIPKLRTKTFSHYAKTDSPVLLQKGFLLNVPFQIREFDAENFAFFYKYFAQIRNLFPEQKPFRNTRSFSSAIQDLLYCFNEYRYRKEARFYAKCGNQDRLDLGFVSFVELPALLLSGDEETQKRVRDELEEILTHAPMKSGYFYPSALWKEGKNHYFGGERETWKNDWTLVRYQCEILYTLIRTFVLLEEKGQVIPEQWKKVTCTLAETLHGLWQKSHSMGFMVDEITGKIIVNDSFNGAMAPAALLLAADYFGKEEFIRSAVECGDYFAEYLAEKGFTFGGPSDALFSPDSETAFSLLESLVSLYEKTREECFLQYAQFCADYCSGWVPAVEYSFPEGTLMHRLKVDSRGSVQANLQNQHGAPGCCTMSGSSLLRLYYYTGEERFLALLQEIAHNCVQYIATDDTTYTHYNGKSALRKGEISEKVYFQDARFPKGEINGASGGWTESSVLMTLTDNPGMVYDGRNGKFFMLDHLEYRISNHKLTLKNPFDTPVKSRCLFLTETPLPTLERVIHPDKGAFEIELAPGEEKTIPLP